MSSIIPNQPSPDVRALADVLLAASVGQTVTYGAMDRAIGAPVLARRWLIQSARDLALRESGAAFMAVKGIGMRRLPAEEASAVGVYYRTSIRRTAKRSARVMTQMVKKANDLPDQAKLEAYREISVALLFCELAKATSVKRVPLDNKPAPTGDVVRAMLGFVG